MGTEQAKNSVNLSEDEIIALLEIMFDLGIMSKNLSYYDLESYTEKFYNKFTYKKWTSTLFFLDYSLLLLTLTKHYRPNELNNIISNNIRKSDI